MAISTDNTPSGSALRHAATAIVASAITAAVAKHEIPLPADAINEGANWVTMAGVAVGTAIASAIGSLWRKFVSG